jgi:hypothetical protein
VSEYVSEYVSESGIKWMNLVWSGCTVVQRNNATELYAQAEAKKRVAACRLERRAKDELAAAAAQREAGLGLGRIVALHHGSSTPHQIR